MTRLRRPSTILVALAATLLLSFAAPTADARLPRATHYRVGGAITLDTNLLSVSGTSAWAINQYLASATSLPPLGAAFIGAEKKYGVNARFLLAAAMHESAWGSSYIARVKHNLFGYNAYDRDPFRYASAYRTYEANIDATAKFIRDFYLRPSGRWWGGAPTLRSMQQFWSGSHRWGVNVSQIANSIHLATIKGHGYTFAAPVVHGQLHGGDRTTVQLSWSGGAIPAGVDFVATWVPVQLDADAVAAAAAAAASGTPAAIAAPATVTEAPTAVRAPITVAASRIRSASRSVSLSVSAPRQPGTYTLRVDMRDTGRVPLPAAQRVVIPEVPVRVWGDLAVSVSVAPSVDGNGATVQITNTGRKVIPAVRGAAAPSRDAIAGSAPGSQPARTVVSVTAASADTGAAPVPLLSEPLTADLKPGASVQFTVSDVAAATGRAVNWVSVGVSVLGNPTTLAAYAPAGVWLSGATATAAGIAMQPASSHASAAPASPSPSPAPAAAPTATPAPARAAATAAPKPTPKPTPKPAPRHVTRVYQERSGSVTYRGRWGTASGNYAGGSVAYSTAAGATATFSFTGSSVSWIGPLGPTRGAALVLLDGRVVAQVNLWRSTFVAQAVLFHRAFTATGHHTLTIKVLSDPGHPYVAIDEFIIRT